MAKRLPSRVRRYIWWMSIPTAMIIAIAIWLDLSPSSDTPWLSYLFFVGIGWLGEEYRVQTRQGAYHTLTAAIHPALIFLLTPVEAICVATLSCICAQLRRRRSSYIIAYNAIVRVISIGVPSIVLALWRTHDRRFAGQRTLLNTNILAGVIGKTHAAPAQYVLFSVELLLACCLAALLYIVLDSVLISTVVAIQTSTSLIASWQTNMRVAIVPEVTKSIIGIIAATVYAINPVFVVCVVLPVAMTHTTTGRIFLLESETIEAVTALADAIDYRDTYTAQHSVRVAEMARRLAERLGLSLEQIDEITLAARVHDLGKIGIPSDILLKNGRLTADEMAVMQTHPQVGAEILQKYHNFQSTLPIVLHHHERHDGKGYPGGLSGEAIPPGARIIAIADAYDAMTSDRPYRKGLSPQHAVRRIVEASGSQFDSAYVGVFAAMMYEDLAAAGHLLAEAGGSLAEQAAEPELERAAAGAEDKVRYIYTKP